MSIIPLDLQRRFEAMGGSVHLAGRFGCAEERSIEEHTTDRSPGSAEKIAAAVCKDGAPVETGGIERVFNPERKDHYFRKLARDG